MEWTDLHGRLLGRAFEQVLGHAELGTVAFVRCLTPDVVAELVADSAFAPQDWQVSRVADSDDAEARTITADTAVEERERKGAAALLLVDTDRAGAGMDGIYSAAREVDETSLFREARRLAAAEVTRRLSGEHRRYAEQAIRKAVGFGSRYSVSPWTTFDFLCRIAAHRRHPGACLHLLGLWPVVASEEANPADELSFSRLLVETPVGDIGLRSDHPDPHRVAEARADCGRSTPRSRTIPPRRGDQASTGCAGRACRQGIPVGGRAAGRDRPRDSSHRARVLAQPGRQGRQVVGIGGGVRGSPAGSDSEAGNRIIWRLLEAGSQVEDTTRQPGQERRRLPESPC